MTKKQASNAARVFHEVQKDVSFALLQYAERTGSVKPMEFIKANKMHRSDVYGQLRRLTNLDILKRVPRYEGGTWSVYVLNRKKWLLVCKAAEYASRA